MFNIYKFKYHEGCVYVILTHFKGLKVSTIKLRIIKNNLRIKNEISNRKETGERREYGAAQKSQSFRLSLREA